MTTDPLDLLELLNSIPSKIYYTSAWWTDRKQAFKELFADEFCEVCEIRPDYDIATVERPITIHMKSRQRKSKQSNSDTVRCKDDGDHDSHACQALTETRTEPVIKIPFVVHHLSYKHLGAETDEELMLVCEPCHRIIHSIPDDEAEFESQREAPWMSSWLQRQSVKRTIEELRALAPTTSFAETF